MKKFRPWKALLQNLIRNFLAVSGPKRPDFFMKLNHLHRIYIHMLQYSWIWFLFVRDISCKVVVTVTEMSWTCGAALGICAIFSATASLARPKKDGARRSKVKKMARWQWRTNYMALIHAISGPNFALQSICNATYWTIIFNLNHKKLNSRREKVTENEIV